MSALDLALATQLQKKLAEIRDRAVLTLGEGTCKDFSEYRYGCGYLKGLDDALKVAAEIIEDIQKG